MVKLGSIVFVVPFLFVLGCDEPQIIAPDREGERGESCEARNDCESGLACVYNVCVVNEFDIDPTAKHCEVHECVDAEDCCGAPFDVTYCQDLELDCLQSTPDSFYCEDYLADCACEYLCVANQCRFAQPCIDDVNCWGGGECRGGFCDMSCENNDDCFGETICIDGECIEACRERTDCPYFHDCRDNVCVEVGCETDRECAAYTGNALAECNEAQCAIPCENDAECNEGVYQFFACLGGLCIYVGCETDEECRIFLGIEPGSERQAVCIDD